MEKVHIVFEKACCKIRYHIGCCIIYLDMICGMESLILNKRERQIFSFTFTVSSKRVIPIMSSANNADFTRPIMPPRRKAGR